jgi:hypothetical protein
LEFLLQGTILIVAPVSTKYLSFVNSSVKKIRLALAGKCIAVAVACVGVAAEPKVVATVGQGNEETDELRQE